MAEMGVSTEDVDAVLQDPELTYPQTWRDRKPQVVYVRGNIGVVLSNDGTNTVVTVIWHLASER